jgi:hydrogenase expression/formation protein HypC
VSAVHIEVTNLRSRRCFGVAREVSLAFVPDAKVGDYVVVHVGFALSVLDEAEARRTLEDIAAMTAMADAEGKK